MGGPIADLKSIFGKALEIHSPAVRAAYLDQACGGDPGLRADVESLLRAQGAAGGFLDRLRPAAGPTLDQSVNERPGARIGPYKLLEEIGEGGFGVVFLAEQTQPLRRQVALKVLKPGMDTRQVVARFEAERQALALMDHPNIARVFDGGETATGRPFFAMELVKGIPITDYCDQCRLTASERLDLFLSVCLAVQHAHQKGVIHRDIKPSNILVAIQDGKPTVKVIDFGVAKAINQQLSEHTLVTGFHQMIGTPLYMSPEQAEMSPLDVDTRADIYSLGVLQYELLTSTTPFEKERLSQAGYDEFRRIIREEEPPRPSARLSTLQDRLTPVAAQRRTEPRHLLRTVRGELDWIVMKCLEKDRNRRYDTANSLAMDVQRYLADEPVLACPPSLGYRLRKFARRNKGALAIVGTALFSIVLLGAFAGWVIRDREVRQARRAADVLLALERGERLQQEGRVAEGQAAVQQAELLADELPVDAAVRERLTALKTRLEADVRDEAFLACYEQIRLLEQSEIRVRKSQMFFGWEAFPELKQALHDFGLSVGVTTSEHAIGHIDSRPKRVQLAVVAALHDCLKSAPANDAATKAWLKQVLDGVDRDAWRIRIRRLEATGDWQQAADLLARVDMEEQPPTFLIWAAEGLFKKGVLPDLAIHHRIQQTYPNDIWANVVLADRLDSTGQAGDAARSVRYWSAALALRPDNLGILLNRALALKGAGEVAEAVADLRRAIRLEPRYSALHYNLGIILRDSGDHGGALAAFRQAVAVDPQNDMAHNNLGMLLDDMNDHTGAIACYQKAIAINPNHDGAHVNWGAALLKRDDHPRAIELFRKAIALNPNNSTAYQNLGGSLLHSNGDLKEAITVLNKAVTVDPENAVAYCLLGMALEKVGDSKAAIDAYRQATRLNTRDAQAQNRLGSLLANKGDYKAAVPYFQAAIKLDPHQTQVWRNLGISRAALGDHDAAIAAFKEAIARDPRYAKAYRGLGISLAAKNDHAAAIDAYRKALAIEADWLTSFRLGLALAETGAYRDAVSAYRQAIESRPNYHRLHYVLGNALREAGQVDEAISAFRTAIELKPDFAEAHWNLGVVLSMKGRHGEALASLRRGHELGSKQPGWDPMNFKANLLTQAEESAGKAHESVKPNR
jgi:tetratricopeptide (TPR) repeat protein/serine/threonine protein kinase